MKVSKLLLPVVAGGLALALAACGGPVASPSAGAPSAGASSAASSAPASTGWDINETPRDQLTGGEFVGSMSYPIATWNIASVDGNDAELTLLESPISPIYYSYTGAGDPVMSKDFLLSAEPVVTDGKLVVTM